MAEKKPVCRPRWKKVDLTCWVITMPWGGKVAVWDSPIVAPSMGDTHRQFEAHLERCWESGSTDKSLAELYDHLIAENKKANREWAPAKMERERLERIQRHRDEDRVKANYEAAVKLLRSVARRPWAMSDKLPREIRALIRADREQREEDLAYVESERRSHIEMEAFRGT